MILARERLREVSTFAVVGIAATLTHLCIAWMAHRLGASPQGANFTGWIVAVGVSFLGHARLTFRVGGALGPYLPRFLMLSGLAFVVSALVVGLSGRAGLPFWAGLLLVGLTVPPASYLAQRVAVFRSAAPATDPGELLAAAFGLSLFLWFRGAYVNHDVAWYLVAARQWIEGARLYIDISEVNPPLAFYLTRAALHLGDLFALDPAASLAAFVAMLSAVSLGWVSRILPRDTPHRLPVLCGIAAAMILPFLGHFGQREHLMVILVLPWVAAALFRPDPLRGPGAVARGIVAGIGICLKPHFLVYPLALTLTECARTRSLRPVLAPGNLAMGSVGLAYVAGVAAVHTEYFTIIVPDARLVYGAYALPFDLIVANLAPLPVLLVALVLMLGREGLSGQRTIALFAAAIAAYALQGNGFTYHAAPIHALAIIGASVLAARASRPLASAALAVIALFAWTAVEDGGYRNPLSERLEARLDALALQPERLLVWSPSLLPAFPLVLETGAEWSGHAASLWLLPGTLDLVETGGARQDPRQPVLTRAQHQMARDLARCPDVVILDRELKFRERPLDLVAYASVATAGRLNAEFQRVHRGERFDILTRARPCAGP